jgi:hypothetical protein
MCEPETQDLRLVLARRSVEEGFEVAEHIVALTLVDPSRLSTLRVMTSKLRSGPRLAYEEASLRRL